MTSSTRCSLCDGFADAHIGQCSALLRQYAKYTQPQPSLEVERRQRHHDVFLAVLAECVRVANRLHIPDEESARVVREGCVQVARDYADAAYPPPEKQ